MLLKTSPWKKKRIFASFISSSLLALLLLAEACASGVGTVETISTDTARPTQLTSYTPTRSPTLRNSATPTKTLTPKPSLTLTHTSSPSYTATPTDILDGVSNGGCLPRLTKQEIGVVTSVVDGDTIIVEIEGVEYKVQYIGADAPEPSSGAAGVAAAEQNSDLVLGQTVTLISDTTDVDRYSRLLRYVIVGEIFVNEYMIRMGWAEAKIYPPDVACEAAYQSAQSAAMANLIGIWEGVMLSSGARGISTELTVTAPAQGSENCVCSRDYDCGDFSTHAEAQACFESCGGSTTYNWSYLDGDHDGSACESLP